MNEPNDIRIVWSVSHGEYSDYTVQFLFTRREVAEAYIAAKQSSDWFVEDFKLIDSLPPSRRYYVKAAHVTADGIVEPWEESEWEAFPGIDHENERVHVTQNDRQRRGLASRWIRVEGFNGTAVAKSYTERVARAKYELGLTPPSGRPAL